MHLSTERPVNKVNSSGAQAAVLIPLMKKDDGWHMLFQQRALDIEMQPGDVCFPGGHTEQEETPEETVLREVAEELLVQPSQITIVRSLPARPGPGGLTVTPFIGILRGYAGHFDPAEVDHVFTAPVSSLAPERPDVYIVPGEPEIWGFTGRLVTEFLERFDLRELTDA